MGRFRLYGCAFAALLLTGCYASSRLAGDGSGHDGIPPDAVETHEIVDVDAPPPDMQDPDMPTDPDVLPDVPPPGTCATSADCVVAIHEERCCIPCPEVMTRAEMAMDPCLHELGTAFPFPVPTPTCQRDCTWCAPCGEPPIYMARCEGGRCMPSMDGCDYPDIATPIPSLSGSDFMDEDRWAPYAGQLVSVRGAFFPGPDSCACCFDCFCDCFETPVQPTIDCALTLLGTVCGQTFQCPGTECDASCTPVAGNAYLSAMGFLVPEEMNVPKLWVIEWGEFE